MERRREYLYATVVVICVLLYIAASFLLWQADYRACKARGGQPVSRSIASVTCYAPGVLR